MKNKLERNLPVLYGFSFFWLSMVIIPVIVPLFESKGLTLSQVFYLQAIFAGFVVLFEVPLGYIAALRQLGSPEAQSCTKNPGHRKPQICEEYCRRHIGIAWRLRVEV